MHNLSLRDIPSRYFAFLVVMSALFTQACAPPVTTSYRHEMTIHQGSKTRAEQESLLMEAEPVLLDELMKDPMVHLQLPYEITIPMTSTQVTRTADLSLLMPPAFKVKITNRTGHVVRLNGAVIRLSDDLGNTYDALSREQVEATLYDLPNIFAAHDAVLGPKEVQAAISASRRLKLLDENTTLLPNSTSTWFVTFLTPAQGSQGFDAEAYDGFLNSVQVMTLSLYDVVTETDAAGTPLVKAIFEFPFEVKSFKETHTGEVLTSSEAITKS